MYNDYATVIVDIESDMVNGGDSNVYHLQHAVRFLLLKVKLLEERLQLVKGNEVKLSKVKVQQPISEERMREIEETLKNMTDEEVRAELVKNAQRSRRNT